MMRSQPSFVGVALARLRVSILMCCWIIGLALIVHLGVWLVATFTDVRHEVIKAGAAPTLIVNSTVTAPIEPAGIEAGKAAAITKAQEAADPNRVLSKYDRMMSMAVQIASAAAMLALLVLVPLMALSVMLAAGSVTPGVEQTVSSFTWAVLLALLLLPLGEFVGLPWREGAMYSYAAMTDLVDAANAKKASQNLTYYARFGVLPLACVIGTGMIGLRFCAGVEAALPKKEDMRLDPTLEREAANITPTSLHGARAGVAFRTPPPPAPASNGSQPHPAGMTVPTAGVAPKRLI